MTDRTIGDKILRQLQVLTFTVCACLVLSVGVAIYAWVDSGNKADDIAGVASTTNTALCAFRNDVESRASQTAKFLADNPKGFAGIPAATLRQSLQGQRRAVASLKSLDCPPPAIP